MPGVALDLALFESPSVRVGRFVARPQDRDFATAGDPQHHHWVFPGTPVWINPADAPPFVADPNIVTLYNPGQRYRRSKLSEFGDLCHWFSADAELVREAISEHDPSARDRPAEALFDCYWLPSSARAFALQHQILRRLAGGSPDGLAMEESVIQLLLLTLESAGRNPGRPRVGVHKQRRDLELVEHSRAVLAGSYCEPLDLATIAQRVGSSVFHLCKVFRQLTGTTMHRYLTELRLRAALARLPEKTNLTELALELGFSSHSHFSYQFRRWFGVPPSTVR